MFEDNFTANIRQGMQNLVSQWGPLARAKGHIAAQIRAQRCQSSLAHVFNSTLISGANYDENGLGSSSRYKVWNKTESTLVEQIGSFRGVPLLSPKYNTGVTPPWETHSGQLSGSFRSKVLWDVTNGVGAAVITVAYQPFLSRHIFETSRGLTSGGFDPKKYGDFILRGWRGSATQDRLSEAVSMGQNLWGTFRHIYKKEVSPKFAGRTRTLKKGGVRAKANAERTLQQTSQREYIRDSISLRWGL